MQSLTKKQSLCFNLNKLDITDYLLDGKCKHRTLIRINSITYFSFLKDRIKLYHYDKNNCHHAISLKNEPKTLEILEKHLDYIEPEVCVE